MAGFLYSFLFSVIMMIMLAFRSLHRAPRGDDRGALMGGDGRRRRGVCVVVRARGCCVGRGPRGSSVARRSCLLVVLLLQW